METKEKCSIRYEFFKPVYYQSTHYTCDFYRIVLPDGDLAYEVEIQIFKEPVLREPEKVIMQMKGDGKGNWKFIAGSSRYSMEFERMLSELIKQRNRL